ncbi:MAG: hypothetical protein Q8O76_10375 [Chloroflexota bacterium]|nr:hypothetical protein [Chloroflexota bacterium]
MTPVSWSAVAHYIEGAYGLKGKVERADCLDMAFAHQAPDDVVDTLDALGSRVFPSPQAAREFLAAQGWVSKDEG